jgi:hypothetical protein
MFFGQTVDVRGSPGRGFRTLQVAYTLSHTRKKQHWIDVTEVAIVIRILPLASLQ